MTAPSKIYVGITDGKHYSIVGEGYPNAKEYVSVDVVMRWFEQRKNDCKNIYFAYVIREFVEEEFAEFCKRIKD